MTACELVLDGVSYGYRRDRMAVSAISLRLERGIVGLLGPNGAGKSTLMRLLATLTKPKSGRILWNGTDIARQPDVLRRDLGFLPQDFGVYPALTAREFLAYLAAVKGLPKALSADRIDACLSMVGLSDAADRRLGAFSGGCGSGSGSHRPY